MINTITAGTTAANNKAKRELASDSNELKGFTNPLSFLVAGVSAVSSKVSPEKDIY